MPNLLPMRNPLRPKPSRPFPSNLLLLPNLLLYPNLLRPKPFRPFPSNLLLLPMPNLLLRPY